MPDQDSQQVTDTISRNVRTLRDRQGLSLTGLATKAGISRGMLIQIEQGRTNPSLGTLVSVAGALNVSLTELIELEQPAPVRILGPDDGTVLWTGASGGCGRMLAGATGANHLQVWDWRMKPGEEFSALPQPRGTVEVIHVLSGRLTIRVGEETHEVASGHTVMFRPDRPHGYSNRTRRPMRMLISNSEPPGSDFASKEIVDDEQ